MKVSRVVGSIKFCSYAHYTYEYCGVIENNCPLLCNSKHGDADVMLVYHPAGSGTVGVGVSSVRWVAGTTYSVGAGVVTGAGAVVGAVGSTVAAGASTVVSKVSGSKEHSD